MPPWALSPVPDFLLWPPFSYYNSTFLLSSDSVFSTKNAPKLQKQFRSTTTPIFIQSTYYLTTFSSKQPFAFAPFPSRTPFSTLFANPPDTLSNAIVPHYTTCSN